jgi:NitT/TauT family transport system substrate-binding protein
MVKRTAGVLALAMMVAILAAYPGRAAAASRRAAPLRNITIGMGYIPNVQFAPYYVADQRGYYRRAGLNVTFSYAFSPNLLELVGAGRMDFANADGTDVIAAAARGVPIVYAAAEYQRFPVCIFALAKSGIHTIADLRGKTIGIPGLYGSSYVGLLAALHAGGLKPSDVHIEAINYTQVESVAAGKVDAAVGFSTNEPLVLARRGYKVTTIQIGDVANLVAPGLIVGKSLAAHDPALVRAFIQATLHGLADTIADPQAAFAMSRHVHGLTALSASDARDQYAVLVHTIAFWHSASTRLHGLGYADPAQWSNSVRLLQAIGQVSDPPKPAALFTNAFVAGAPKL